MKTLALEAHGEGLKLAYEIRPDTPDALLGDPVRLGQIVLNLVGNAIKFTERGEVVMRVQPQSSDGAEVNCYFTVSDTGIGIDREKQTAIFPPFLQGDTSTTRLYGGTGLGLTVSERLVEMMNGKIWVDSEPGKGSIFHFTVRFGLQKVAQGEQVAIDFKELRALVVEDHALSRRILEIDRHLFALRHFLQAETYREVKNGSLARLAVDPDLAVHHFQQKIRNGQPEAGAAVKTRRRDRALEKRS